MIDGPVCFRMIFESALARVSPLDAAEVMAMRRTELAKFGFAVLVAVGAAGLMTPCGVAQDAQPSVADAARAAAAAKKDKDKNNAAKTVITDDSLGSGAVATSKAGGAAAAGTAQGSGSVSGAASGDAAGGSGMNSASLDAAWARLQATEASLDQLEPLGKSEVATTVLGGNSADFPGRADWEEKMYAEKTTYVVRSRQLIAAMKEALLRMAQMNSGDQKLSSHDPQVMSLTRKTTQLMQLAQKTEAEFQSVVSEGRSMAQGGK
jgi:hypothetical protein